MEKIKLLQVDLIGTNSHDNKPNPQNRTSVFVSPDVIAGLRYIEGNKYKVFFKKDAIDWKIGFVDAEAIIKPESKEIL